MPKRRDMKSLADKSLKTRRRGEFRLRRAIDRAFTVRLITTKVARNYRIRFAVRWYLLLVLQRHLKERLNQAVSNEIAFLVEVFSHLAKDCGLCDQDTECLTNRLKSEGLPFATKTLPSLGKALDRALGDGQFVIPDRFARKKKGSSLPAFLYDLFSKVFDENGKLLPQADSVSVWFIRQICFFAYKANLPFFHGEEDRVVSRFLQTEEEIRKYRFDRHDPILRTAAAFTSHVFSGYDPRNLDCRHGPGVTSNCAVHEKYDSKLSPIPSVSYFGEYFFFSVHDAMERLNRYPVWSNHELFRSIGNCASVILVPKDSRGPRLISAEPHENQFVQQGIARFMTSAIESSDFCRGQVNFRDQSINQRLAVEGSKSQQWSTLDLKDASDRVTCNLVDAIFLGSGLHSSLFIARSEYTNVQGERIKLTKYAPMGSALCFPVMAWCIYALLVSAIYQITGDLAAARSSVFVYGDDIVVPTNLARYCVLVLKAFGLAVNEDKCFINSRFLESCGHDAFDGNLVTPIRLRECDITYDDSLLTEKPAILVSLTETANLLAESGFILTSKFLYGIVESWLGVLPYGYHHSPYLHKRVLPSMRGTAVQLTERSLFVRRTGKKFPNRRAVRCYVVKDVKLDTTLATPYGHMSRIWRAIGTGLETLPKEGVFSAPKRFVLSPSVLDTIHMGEHPDVGLRVLYPQG